MGNPSSPAAAPPVTETWTEIEDLVDQLARLAKEDRSSDEFYSALLDRAVQALAAVGGAIWTRDAQQRLCVRYQIHLAKTGLGHPAAQPGHAALLEDVARDGAVRAVPPQSGGSAQALANPTSHLLLLGPVKDGDASLGVVEIFQRPGTSPAAQRGFLQLLGVLCDLTADHHRQQQLRRLQQREDQWSQWDQFAEQVHGSLELDRTAFLIANEGRRLIGCDRVGVLVGRRCRTLAISGLETVDRRANIVRHLEQLGRHTLAAGEPFWYRGDASELPPQLESLLHSYVDHSHAQTLAVLPLVEHVAGQKRPRPLGALVVERFDSAGRDEAFEQRVDVVARHSAAALRNAITYDSVPLMPLQRALGRLGRNAAAWLFGLVVLAAIAYVLVFVPADFEIQCRGELQPQERSNIFAPNDGVVRTLHVTHAQSVAQGEPLVELWKPELAYELTRVLGEKQTVQKQLASVQISKQSRPSGSAAEKDEIQLSGREEELKEQLVGLEKQLENLRQQEADLRVVSPRSGQVQTWNVNTVLESRPVQRGQLLMTVVNPDGPWELEIRVPDRHIGYVLDAQRNLGRSDLDVTFMLATAPGTVHKGQIGKVAMSTETDDKHNATVLVRVQIDPAAIEGRRPGATVTSRIACGRASLGYVWLHDVIEAARAWLLL